MSRSALRLMWICPLVAGMAGCGSKTQLGAGADASPEAEVDAGRCGGILCGEATFGPWGPCESESPCAPEGVRSRSVLTPICLAGACREVTGTQTESCTRDVRGTVCRESVLPCDVPEFCDGVSPLCPPDEVSDADVVCRRSEGECDVDERCGGSTKECPPDRGRPEGTPCSEGGTCMGDPPFCS